jgi:hypothetical protein
MKGREDDGGKSTLRSIKRNRQRGEKERVEEGEKRERKMKYKKKKNVKDYK